MITGLSTSCLRLVCLQLLQATSSVHTRIAGYFRGVLIFVILVVSLQVMKISTHEFFPPM